MGQIYRGSPHLCATGLAIGPNRLRWHYQFRGDTICQVHCRPRGNRSVKQGDTRRSDGIAGYIITRDIVFIVTAAFIIIFGR